MKIKVALIVASVLVLLSFGLAGSHENPPVQRTGANAVQWDSPATAELFDRACQDCHSNTTRWPWYSKIAPVSWAMQHNVNEGRGEFNVSMMDMGEADEAGEAVQEEEMPPWDYLLMHPEARLSPIEKQTLIDGLNRTFGSEADDD